MYIIIVSLVCTLFECIEIGECKGTLADKTFFKLIRDMTYTYDAQVYITHIYQCRPDKLLNPVHHCCGSSPQN